MVQLEQTSDPRHCRMENGRDFLQFHGERDGTGRSEGFARTGYLIPGCDGNGAWTQPGNSSAAAVAAVAAAVRPKKGTFSKICPNRHSNKLKVTCLTNNSFFVDEQFILLTNNELVQRIIHFFDECHISIKSRVFR